MNDVAAAGAIELTGPPRGMSARVPYQISDRILPIAVDLGGNVVVFEAHARPFGRAASEIRLRLPRDTPAGTYRGELSLPDGPRGTVVRVAAKLDLRVQPKQTLLDAAPGSAAEFAVDIINYGNVTYDIPKSDVFDIDDAAGQDRALGRALRAPLDRDERRVDRFFEELRADHGGEARVTVVEGAGPLQPGESRALRCHLDLPDSARAGASYVGAWKLANVAHVVLLRVLKPTGGNGRTAQ